MAVQQLEGVSAEYRKRPMSAGNYFWVQATACGRLAPVGDTRAASVRNRTPKIHGWPLASVVMDSTMHFDATNIRKTRDAIEIAATSVERLLLSEERVYVE